jgi:dethiobiotin synthetase
MTSDPSPGPADVDVSEVTSRLPAANVVFTSRPGSKGFAFPPLPLAGGAVPTPRPDADAPIPLDPAAGPARPPDGPMVAALPDGPSAIATALPDGPLATALPDGPLATALPDGPLATALPDGPLATTPPAGPDEPAAPPSGVPVSPGPIGPAPDPDDLPSGEALGAEIDEIAAELSAQAPAAQTAPRRPDTGEWRGIVLVTGTDTDVGKTIVTAAVAAAALASGLRVAVIKPGQTGLAAGAPTDIEVINRLAGPDTARTLAEYPEPMAPLPAATIASMPPLELYEVVDAIRAEADKHDLVLVEGAGGLLVPMGVRPSGEAWTLADLATTLGVRTIVVARAGLGTLNHTALTLEALARRGVPAGVVIGAWPADPELVHWANLSELLPHLVGALPEGAGRMDPGVFRRSAPGWLTPALYGVLDNWRVWAEDTGDGHH